MPTLISAAINLRVRMIVVLCSSKEHCRVMCIDYMCMAYVWSSLFVYLGCVCIYIRYIWSICTRAIYATTCNFFLVIAVLYTSCDILYTQSDVVYELIKVIYINMGKNDISFVKKQLFIKNWKLFMRLYLY